MKKKRFLIKICGNRYVEDAHLVAAHEPDFMGWIFSHYSPRRIPLSEAILLIRRIRQEHPGIRHVAVFAGNGVPEILHTVHTVREFDFLQVVDGPGFIQSLRVFMNRHFRDAEVGNRRGAARSRLWNSVTRHPLLPPELLLKQSIATPQGVLIPQILPAIRVESPLDDSSLSVYGRPPLYVLDSYVKGMPGGTGHRFDPSLVERVTRPYLLAGGLRPENLAQALAETTPRGVDVSSGIEISPGRKDPGKLKEFIEIVRSYDRA